MTSRLLLPIETQAGNRAGLKARSPFGLSEVRPAPAPVPQDLIRQIFSITTRSSS